jgi:hypothetical protein
MEILNFYKDTDSKWYIDYPKWEGEKWELEMVSGADTLLDILGQGDDKVSIKMSLENFEDSNFMLVLLYEESEGGVYDVLHPTLNMTVWLCHVTKFVFGELPETIYCKK